MLWANRELGRCRWARGRPDRGSCTPAGRRDRRTYRGRYSVRGDLPDADGWCGTGSDRVGRFLGRAGRWDIDRPGQLSGGEHDRHQSLVAVDTLFQALAGAAHPTQQFTAVGRASLRIATSTGQHQRIDIIGDRFAPGLSRMMTGQDLRGRRDVLVDMLVGDRNRGFTGIGFAAGQHLEQHDAGGIDIRPGMGASRGQQFGW